MRSVRFTSDAFTRGAAAAALLPNDVAAQVISDGIAEAYRFPDMPHGNEAGQIASTRDMGASSVQAHQPRRTYRTKDA
ncbi:MAG: hypothetical protein U1E25_14555 [Methylocystis sp.]